jgi:hypothetical protein
MWRLVLTSIVLFANLLASAVVAQDDLEPPVDLAAMTMAPPDFPDGGYQFARGGYLTRDDTRYLIERHYTVDGVALDSVLTGGSWRQGYSGAYVLLADRSDRTSEPIVTVTTTIHELGSEDDANVLEILLVNAPPPDADEHDPAVPDAFTWRVVTSQDDTLRTVVRSGRFLVEIETAHRRLTPDAAEHAEGVAIVLGRVEAVNRSGEPGLSQKMVLMEGARLVPLAIATESPLVHTWYRMIDREVIASAGELDPPDTATLPQGVTDIAIARQTAEIASRNWLTVGVVTLRFGSDDDARAFAESGVLHDPLDDFAASEGGSRVAPGDSGYVIEAISGDTRVGGRYSGIRVTFAGDALAAQMTVRSMGSTLIDREIVEAWVALQRDCLAGGSCDSVSLDELVQHSDTATPVATGNLEDTYTSPVASWSVEFDPLTWHVQETFAEGGYDYLYLRSERMDATFETIVDHRGDPEQCVLDELERLRQDEPHAVITVGSDDELEVPGGLADTHGWVVYTVEQLEDSHAADDYSIRIDCYTVVAGAISLVVHARAPRDAWSEVSALGDTLRAGIEIDGAKVSTVGGGQARMSLRTRSDVMIDRRLAK